MVLVLLLAFVLFVPSLHAQFDVNLSFSLGGVLTSVNSTFSPLPGIPAPSDTLTFRGENNSLSIPYTSGALSGLFRVGAMKIGGGARGSFYRYTPSYEAREEVPIAGEGEVLIATLGHHLSTTILVAQIEPFVRFEPLPWLGAEIGLPLTFPFGTSYDQTQKFLDPAGLTFVDGSVERLTARGEVPGLRSAVVGIGGRIDVSMPVGTPEKGRIGLFFTVNTSLGSVHTTADWRPTTYGAGGFVRLNIFSSRPTIEPLRPVRSDTTRDTVVVLSTNVVTTRTELAQRSIDSVYSNDTLVYNVVERYHTLTRKPPSLLRVSVKVGFEQPDGTVSDDARLLSTRLQRTRIVPLLPAVMFDSASARLPSRYRMLKQREAQRWNEQRLVQDTGVHWQYHVLNVIGSRMRRVSAATVEVLAYNNGTPASRDQSRARAETVQQYLVDVFKISAQRLPIIVTTDAANTAPTTDAANTAPWVYLRDRTSAVSGPLRLQDTITESQLPQVRIVPEIVSEAGLASWSVQLVHRGRTVRTFRDSTPRPQTLTWDMREDITMDAVIAAPVVVEVEAVDAEGTTTRGEPGRISLQGNSVIDASARLGFREEVLIVPALDNLRTPDADMLPVPGEFRRIIAPREGGWFRKGLTEPELSLYRSTSLYINEERRP